MLDQYFLKTEFAGLDSGQGSQSKAGGKTIQFWWEILARLNDVSWLEIECGYSRLKLLLMFLSVRTDQVGETGTETEFHRDKTFGALVCEWAASSLVKRWRGIW